MDSLLLAVLHLGRIMRGRHLLLMDLGEKGYPALSLLAFGLACWLSDQDLLAFFYPSGVWFAEDAPVNGRRWFL